MFQVPSLLKEFGPIDYIDFSPVEPHYFAVTCSVRVSIDIFGNDLNLLYFAYLFKYLMSISS